MNRSRGEWLVRRSTRALAREGRRDFLHGYVYARWTYLSIGAATRPETLPRPLQAVHRWAARILVGPLKGPEAARRFADTYPGKVVPTSAADALVTLRVDVELRDLETVIRSPPSARGTTGVWLDCPFGRVFLQLLRRTVRRPLRREELWSGNRESLRKAFFSRDSIFLWAIGTHARRKREYPELFARPEHAHLTVVRLRSPRGARRWLSGVVGEAGRQRSRNSTRPEARS